MNEISMLEKYGEDLTKRVFITNPAIGRDDEIKELILILLTPEKSAILTGKPGIGKTAIVEGLAYLIQINKVPNALLGYTIIKINTPALIGTTNSGDAKIQVLLEELKKLDKVILFIDEIHTLIASNSEQSLDFANMFKPGLDRGSIKVIGATTTEEYERYILRDKAFVRRFQKVEVLEPTREQTIEIMMGTIPKIEKKTGVVLDYSNFTKEQICAFIVDLTTEYRRIYEIGSRYPDICLTLLTQAFSYAVFDNMQRLTINHIYKAIANTKNVYPDVVKKELVRFNQIFKDTISEENIGPSNEEII
ncbi:MAG: AAA family ATPase [Bacilli bacterium]